ncbi:lipase 3 [Halyomorpha halys]|uniref:lipase 3 n=1 Tax=Halyomorpha halys TaxID=286706 RepID=UPI0006D514C1|nr:lipase 3-like [Halyomorpha halys]
MIMLILQHSRAWSVKFCVRSSMGFILAIVIVVAVASVVENSATSVENLIRDQGYPFENHTVVTEDGYILTLHRIPHGKNHSGKLGRPVLLWHAILCSSAAWVLSRPDKALGFILADQGYDVWLANSRGNTYSKMHKTLSVLSPEYWNFSFHEIGYYDLPACIDYILQQTGEDSLQYIGHSQGSTIFFVLASTRPEYNNKVSHMTALAPIAFLNDAHGIIRVLITFSSVVEFVYQITGNYEFLSASSFVHVLEKGCVPDTLLGYVCNSIVFLSVGNDPEQWNMTLAYEVYKYIPAGSSLKQFSHFSQIAKNGGYFRPYDYSYSKNLEIYARYEPPCYDLSKISTPITLYYAQNDWLSGVQDVMKLHSSLPNSVAKLVPYPAFHHLDFLWAKDVVTLLYDDLLKTMSEH